MRRLFDGVAYLLDPGRTGGSVDAKCLVFSEWEERAAGRRGGAEGRTACPWRTRSAAGGKLRDAIDAFKGVATVHLPEGEPSPKALLMPLRRGANGLNLTEAQHVILLEPVLDPGRGGAGDETRGVGSGRRRPRACTGFLLQGTVEGERAGAEQATQGGGTGGGDGRRPSSIGPGASNLRG